MDLIEDRVFWPGPAWAVAEKRSLLWSPPETALPGLAAIPIIAVSSFAMKGDEEKARAAGCDDYVTKPYSSVQLLRIIRGFLPEQV